MKDNSSKLNQYCSIHRYVHQEAYEVCDYCLEHKHYLHHRDKYCDYGFSKRNIAICKGCEDSLFGGGGKYRIIIAHEPYDMYERICQVIKDRTTTIAEQQQITIEYFEAVRIAEATPFDSPTAIVKVFKGVTSVRLSERFPELKNELWLGVLWSPSYYLGTAGHVSTEVIERYIQEQQTEWNRYDSTTG